MTFEAIEEFNKALTVWGKATRQMFLLSMASMGLNERIAFRQKVKSNLRRSGVKGKDAQAALTALTGEQPLYESLKVKFKKRSAEIFFISFPFSRHGVFLVKGVSRGHKLSNPREKKDWMSRVLNPQMDALAEIIASKYADGVAQDVLNMYGAEINLN